MENIKRKKGKRRRVENEEIVSKQTNLQLLEREQSGRLILGSKISGDEPIKVHIAEIQSKFNSTNKHLLKPQAKSNWTSPGLWTGGQDWEHIGD